MARSCECKKLLEALDTDPRLALLPLAARMLWLELLRTMHRLGGSVLQFGAHVPNRTELARLLRCDLTELEPNLDLLLERALLMQNANGALMSPLLAAAMSRSEINRANGMKASEGHRRRKAERQAAAAAQPSLLMPITGGRSDSVTEPRTEPDIGSAQSLDSARSDSSQSSAVATDCTRIGFAVIEAAGFDSARWTGHFGLVRAWLNQGASEALIIDVVTEVAAKARRAGTHISSLGYFSRAVTEAIAAAKPSDNGRNCPAWARECRAWEAGGRVGKMPDFETFYAQYGDRDVALAS